MYINLQKDMGGDHCQKWITCERAQFYTRGYCYRKVLVFTGGYSFLLEGTPFYWRVLVLTGGYSVLL